MGLSCEDCKFSHWDYDTFLTFGEGNYWSEQFDCYCEKINSFFLEGECQYNCPLGKYGDNNYYSVCAEYYRLRKRYTDLLAKFREELDNDTDRVVLRNSLEEFDLWKEYIKTHDKNLYVTLHI
jgi:hypothetical protein